MNDGNGQDRNAPPSRGLLRWLRFIPNTLTLCNSLCGYAAILITLQAYKQGEIQQIDGVMTWVPDKQGMATITMSFEIGSIEELNRLIGRLRQVSGVIDIQRSTGG